MDVVVESPFSEPEFFNRADTLWEQFERAVVAEAENGASLLSQVDHEGAYSFLLATADRVFTHQLVLGFLDSLRRMGKEKLEASHASTPQIHVYVDGCRRRLAPDGVQARWHYLYSLTRGELPSVRLLGEVGHQKKWFRIPLSRITNFQLCFNQLLVHEVRQAYSIDGPKRPTKPLEGVILLSGYLW
jgi:hypothetical protein